MELHKEPGYNKKKQIRKEGQAMIKKRMSAQLQTTYYYFEALLSVLGKGTSTLKVEATCTSRKHVIKLYGKELCAYSYQNGAMTFPNGDRYLPGKGTYIERYGRKRAMCPADVLCERLEGF